MCFLFFDCVGTGAYIYIVVELCADELLVGGGVGRYDRRLRRAANFSSAAAAWLYGRWRQTG